jgi:RNA-directed DNA polymerase
MGKCLEKAMTPAVLNHAWRLLRNDRGAWVHGLPMAEMQGNLIRHVGRLTEEVLSGHYRPEPMRCFEIDKADGGKRLICAASTRDKLVQRAVLTVLEPLGEAVFCEASYGYRPQCTREMALSRVREWVRQGWVWLGDADIKSCFDTIPHRAVLKRLKKLCGDRELVKLTHLWLESMPPAFRPNGSGRGLPQGMLLSPFLCNLHLHALDMKLERKAIPYVRFADDFIVLGRTEHEAKRALRIASRKLWWLGLSLHPDKTQVIRSSRKHHFLGQRLPDGKPRFQA